MTGGTVRVVVADDHAVFRQGLVAMLDAAADIEVVGEATDGREAVSMGLSLEPDVVVMDVQMPGLNGIDAARELSEANSRIGVLMLTMFGDDDTVEDAAKRAGATAYVLKGTSQRELKDAIRQTARGPG
jgi:DNA-binding NarL/FixJ family response regulator